MLQKHESCEKEEQREEQMKASNRIKKRKKQAAASAKTRKTSSLIEGDARICKYPWQNVYTNNVTIRNV